jgi:hypothetical protein
LIWIISTNMNPFPQVVSDDHDVLATIGFGGFDDEIHRDLVPFMVWDWQGLEQALPLFMPDPAAVA